MSLKRNISKTINYGRKNGYANAILAAWERVTASYYKDYTYVEPTTEVLESQRGGEEDILFSILVPTYETPVEYLDALVESCLNQTYSNFELILADGSDTSVVSDALKKYEDARIIYKKLENNGGIADNTNEAIKLAKGDYCCLLDHDDLITKDALYELHKAIKKAGQEPVLVYSDEDKCNSDATVFYEPHFKYDFNFDMFLTNNYVCHLSCIKTDVIKNLMIRKQCEGSQDYDLVLRIVSTLYIREKDGSGNRLEEAIVHVPKVLYHWRCHDSSTADNPQSKMYAYEAGRSALYDFTSRVGWKCDIRHNKHLGFYRIAYKNDVLSHRDDLAAIGGFVSKKGRIASGIYKGQRTAYAGYINRLDLYQNVGELDIRCLALNRRYQSCYQEITGHEYVDTFTDTPLPNWMQALSDTDVMSLSARLSAALTADGARLLLDPERVRKL